ncbi:MAG TPA: RRXRR domain-containing protein [Spirochaetia bacterium]|nr:RRXRR domain-containing protein [Spirochaetia bacterium]
MRQCGNTVGVLNNEGTLLSPARPARARWLLKHGKAKMVSVYPFVIQLTYEIQDPVVMDADMVIDDGETYGIAVVEHRQIHDQVIVGLEGHPRGREISDNLKERRSLRGGRRNRRNKKRRKEGESRFNYRKVSEYPQSIRSDVQAKLNAVKDVLKYFPVNRIILEPVKIDMVRKRRPGVTGKEYQKAPPAACRPITGSKRSAWRF